MINLKLVSVNEDIEIRPDARIKQLNRLYYIAIGPLDLKQFERVMNKGSFKNRFTIIKKLSKRKSIQSACNEALQIIDDIESKRPILRLV